MTEWIRAARPKTLFSGLAPILMGTTFTISEGTFSTGPFLMVLAAAMLLQILVNLTNDYFDGKSGVDNEERLGPERTLASGLISARELLTGIIVVSGITLVLIILLVVRGGLPVILVGAGAFLTAFLYSGTKFSIASHSLGELFAFLFFGPVGVLGSYYLIGLSGSREVLLSSVPLGLLVSSVLTVNNYRDIDTDRAAGKMTLPVRLGRKGTRILFLGYFVIAYLSIPLLIGFSEISSWIRLAYLTIPLSVLVILPILTTEPGRHLNRTLALASLNCLAFSMFFSTGILLG